jgi:hypothetical protein
MTTASCGPNFSQFLLKEYDYHMQRTQVCQDVAKSIVLRALATILLIGVGSWKWITSVREPSLLQCGACIGVTGVILLVVIGYAVFSMYMTWLDRRMCELKLNRIRHWFFSGQDKPFNVTRYEQLSDVGRKNAWKEFARLRRGTASVIPGF